MKRSVRVLRRAQADLEEIHRYVARDRPDAAVRLIDRLLNRIEGLARFPDQGSVPRDDRLRALGFRALVEGEYLIFYKLVRTQVRIYRMLQGRRKYEHMI
jgi:addiction module RelE/StbE family toxin